MSILINQNTKVLVQGITGRDGRFHTARMLAYGTRIVAGVSPGKGGSFTENVPVFNTVRQAVEATGADTSVVFVPAPLAADALLEAAESGIKQVICISEGVPGLDMIRIIAYLQTKGVILIGANCPGLISPGQSLVGILPGEIFRPGRVGLISRSGTLTYEIVHQLSLNGIGQSTCIGIGGDAVSGCNFIDLLKLFREDPLTDAVVLVGEIGGDLEERAARYIQEHFNKPVVAFIAGRTAPTDKRMGHAGAIISSGSGTATEKITAFEAANVPVAKLPEEIPALLARLL